MNFIDLAAKSIKIEIEGLETLIKNLDDNFNKAVDLISKSTGRVIVCGIGKSGIIGSKIAATLASTGTTSMFLHPAEAFHGDLGMIAKEDVFVGISNSGETDELIQILSFVKKNNNPIIGISSNAKSTLAKHSDVFLNLGNPKEACPLDLAPTSTTTNTLVLGDALSIALMEKNKFQPQDFAKFHPGGRLGRRLLTQVKNIMKTENLPFIDQEATMLEALELTNKSKLGICIVGDKGEAVVSDGDIRRALQKHQANFINLKVKDIMNLNPKTVDSEMSLVNAEQLFNKYHIASLLVKGDSKVVGVVQIYDI